MSHQWVSPGCIICQICINSEIPPHLTSNHCLPLTDILIVKFKMLTECLYLLFPYNNKSVSRCLLTRDNKFTVLLLVLLWPGSGDKRSCSLLNNCLLISCIITINYAGIWRMLMNCKLLSIKTLSFSSSFDPSTCEYTGCSNKICAIIRLPCVPEDYLYLDQRDHTHWITWTHDQIILSCQLSLIFHIYAI